MDATVFASAACGVLFYVGFAGVRYVTWVHHHCMSLCVLNCVELAEPLLRVVYGYGTLRPSDRSFPSAVKYELRNCPRVPNDSS
jgi:hypothetical protein